MIEGEAPSDWRDLQNRAARVLRECGLEADTDREIALARGTVKVDVLARDTAATPPALYICECKHWQAPVSKDVVHAFRTVVTDSGAHLGFLISSGGFQSGTHNAASHSNLKLVTWFEFQEIFAERWFRTYMAPVLVEEGSGLHEYTEPINSRITRKAKALPPERFRRFRELQEQHVIPSLGLLMLWFEPFSNKPTLPALPLRASLGARPEQFQVPADVLDAVALRPLMDAVIRFYRQATAEFDEVFGGRA